MLIQFKFTDLLIVILSVILFANAQKYPPTLTIKAPARLRSHFNYRITGTLHQPSQKPVHVEGQIFGNLTDGSIVNETWTFDYNEPTTKIFTYEPGKVIPGVYELRVKVTGGVEFEETVSLPTVEKHSSIYMQTDKAVYKPGQKVQFRVLTLDPLLKPLNKPYDVHILDPNRNRIKQWSDAKVVNGVFEGSLLLSTQPNLGTWTISDNSSDLLEDKTFEVEEYVLPTFNVDVKLPPYASSKNPKVTATVSAMYTFGKKVKGTVVLTARPKDQYMWYASNVKEFKLTKEIDGTTDIEVDLTKDIESYSYRKEFEFIAHVVEELTGKNYSKSNTIEMYDNDVEVKFVSKSKSFKPGMRFIGTMKVAYRDGRPVEDDQSPLLLMIEFNGDYRTVNVNETYYTKNGLIDIDFVVPRSRGINRLSFKALYRNETHDVTSHISSAYSPSNNFLQALSDQVKDPKVGDEVTVRVNSTEPMNHLVYEIIGRGKILSSNYLKLNQEESAEFKFKVTQDMTPRVRVLVYYVREDNQEIVGDSLGFDVDGLFKTPVGIRSNVNEAKPGAPVKITFATMPGTPTYIFGVDQSVQLLKTGNDLSEKDIRRDLEDYDNGAKTEDSYSRKRSIWRPSPRLAHQIFKDSGLIVISNGLVAQHYPIYYPVYGNSVIRNRPALRPPAVAFSAIRPQAEALSTVAALAGAPMASIDTNRNSIEESNKKVVVRKEFPETWLWSSMVSGSDGNAVYETEVPDTITSWLVSGFALNDDTGLGLSSEPTKVKVFQPFFLKLSLPYSIKRGETLTVPVLVFNYQDKPVKADVLFENSKDEFEFVNEPTLDGKSLRKSVEVPANDAVSIPVIITPKKVGDIELKVTGRTETAGDAILKKLKVKPEGVTQYFNKAVLLDLRATKSADSSVEFEIPAEAVPDSEYVTVSGIGDILGPTLNNLDDLLRIPYGCGEQNMINFVPNIVVLDYLTKAGKLTDAIKSKALKNIETGYQRELTYRHDDGSYSAFGKRDARGNTFLTAYVLKSFQQAKPYLKVDPAIVESAAEYLLYQQSKDGSFNSSEHFSHSLSGGSGRSDIAFTSFVLIALNQDSTKAQKKYQDSIELAEKYLSDRLNTTNDPYELAVLTYAFHLSNNPMKDAAFEKLWSLKKSTADFTWFEEKKNESIDCTKSWYSCYAASNDVEMTSYALLTMVLREKETDAVPLLRWLISKQNSNGGFSSTQDTVTAIQGLGQLATSLATNDQSIIVDIESGSAPRQIHFNKESALVLQKHELSMKTRKVNLKATGKGTGIVQVSWQYNLATKETKPAFKLTSSVSKLKNIIKVELCASYLAGDTSNMAVIEANLPSGYEFEPDSLKHDVSVPVKKIEYENSNTKVMVYLDRITKRDSCLNFEGRRVFEVKELKPSPFSVYDYYNRAHTSQAFYNVPEKDEIVPIEITTIAPQSTDF